MKKSRAIRYLIIISFVIFCISCEKEEFNELNTILSESSQKGEIITADDLRSLPELMQVYLKNCNVVGKYRYFNLKMRAKGQFKLSETSGSSNIDNSLYLIFKPVCRFWFGEVPTMTGKIYGMDYYRNGNARFSIRYFPNTSLQEADDQKVVVSELVTWLSEQVCYPAAFLISNIEWGQATDTSIVAKFSDAGISVSGTFYFDNDGLINRFISYDRYKGAGTEGEKIPWELLVDNYKEYYGIKVPTRLRARWIEADGIFEYIDDTVTEYTLGVNKM